MQELSLSLQEAKSQAAALCVGLSMEEMSALAAAVRCVGHM